MISTSSSQDIVMPPVQAMHSTFLGADPCIDVKELRDVDYWASALGVSEVELRMAVAEVGDSARDVREHLGK